MRASVVIPNWNGREWLSGCLDSIAAQTAAPAETIVVDNGSTDGSLELLRERYPWVRRLPLGRNTGFAYAVNRAVAVADTEAVAVVNTDVVLEPDWLARMVAALERDDGAASVACKMVDLRDPSLLYDAGDVLRRDGAAEQRGRFEPDRGDFDEPGEVFAACAGAAVYRRADFLEIGGFDERFFTYLEDVDLGLRLQLRGRRCLYEPVVARHAGEGSSEALSQPVRHWVERNTLLLVAKAFPLRWAPFVLYRQLGWAWHALREGGLGAHVRGALAALPVLPLMLRERRRLRAMDGPSIEEVVPAQPISRYGASLRTLRRSGGRKT